PAARDVRVPPTPARSSAQRSSTRTPTTGASPGKRLSELICQFLVQTHDHAPVEAHVDAHHVAAQQGLFRIERAQRVHCLTDVPLWQVQVDAVAQEEVPTPVGHAYCRPHPRFYAGPGFQLVKKIQSV